MIGRAAAIALLGATLLTGPILAAAPATGPAVGSPAWPAVLGQARTLGFWLGPADVSAVRAAAISRSGLAQPDGTLRIDSLEDARRLRRAIVTVGGAVNRALTTPFLAAARAAGVRDLSALSTAPLVIARVTPAQAAVLSDLPMVRAVEEGGDVQLAMASAYPTIGAPAVYERGFRGGGVRVAVVEYARIDFRRAGLSDVPRQKLRVGRSNGAYVCRSGDPATPDVSVEHMTRVAAIIAGRSGKAPRGVAPGATIIQASIDMAALDTGETAARVAKAIECAITQGEADVVNLSLSEPKRQGYLRTYLDHLVTTYGVFVAVAAGNAVYGTCPDGQPVSPATAWNVLTVGGTDDRGTSRWRDDQLWSEGGRDAVCTDDPPGQVGDRDRRLKPEISAVARNIKVAGLPLSSGTSYATPMVSGAAATLIGRDPVLATQPLVVKAILVASSRVHRTPVTPRGRISTGREGAGTLSVRWAHAIMDGRLGKAGGAGGYAEQVIGSSAAGKGCRRGDNLSVTLPGRAGRNVRVAITWSAHAQRPKLDGDTVDRRKSDLDLVVRRPDGTAIAGASSSRAGVDATNLEWLDFRAPVTGTYTLTIRVQRWDCDLESEPVGLAWIAYRD